MKRREVAIIALFLLSPISARAAGGIDIQVAVLDSGPGTIANGNERLEAGETVRLVFRIANTGQDVIESQSLRLSAEGGVFITGAIPVDELLSGQVVHLDTFLRLPAGTEPRSVSLTAEVDMVKTTWRLSDGYFVVAQVEGTADDILVRAEAECPDLATIEGLSCLAAMRHSRAEALAKAERERQAKIEAERQAKLAAEAAERRQYMLGLAQAYQQVLALEQGGLLGPAELQRGWSDFLRRYPLEHEFGNPHAIEAACRIDHELCKRLQEGAEGAPGAPDRRRRKVITKLIAASIVVSGSILLDALPPFARDGQLEAVDFLPLVGYGTGLGILISVPF